MSTPKRRDPKEDTQTLEFVTQSLSLRYGDDVFKTRAKLDTARPARIASGLPELDTLTGCGGIPQGMITLLTGQTTSGKLSVAHTVLAQTHGPIAVLDLTGATDVESLQAAGVQLPRVLFVRPPKPGHGVTLIHDLLRAEKFAAFFVDGLSDLLSSTGVARDFDAAMPELSRVIRGQRTAFVLVDELAPPWLRWTRLGSAALPHYAALHLAFKRTGWLNDAHGRLHAFTSEIRVERSRWARVGATCQLHFTRTPHGRLLRPHP
jgi:recA bacterial DNA recombination protein